jgi:hypothetical protein
VPWWFNKTFKLTKYKNSWIRTLISSSKILKKGLSLIKININKEQEEKSFHLEFLTLWNILESSKQAGF